MWDDLFQSVNYLQTGLNGTWKRNEVITNNIANDDTPGFKKSDVEFESLFAQALQSDELDTQSASDYSNNDLLSTIEPVVTKNEDSAYRYDENNVDIETEMTSLAKNSIEYYTLVSKMNSEFSKLSTAITGQ